MKQIPITRSSMPPFSEYCEEIRDIWESRHLTNQGPKHRALESALSDCLKVPEVVLYTNGHLALEYALQALNITGEVITTPFTFASTTQAIVRMGLTPVFCDIDPVTWTMDPEKIEALITPRTSAILPVHVYGNLCDHEAIDRIAQRHGLKVIYDAAHAFLETFSGMGVAAMGDVSMFSFHATKVFHTIEGGCLCFSDPALRPVLEAQKNFGQVTPEDLPYAGGNAKMSEFQAAMGLCNLRYVNEEIKKREQAALRYRARLSQVPGLGLSFVDNRVQYNHAYFPVVFEGFSLNRDQAFDWLSAHGITARKYFHPLTNGFSANQGLFPVQETPVAQRIASQVLTLPLYAGLTDLEVDRVCDILLGGNQ